MRCSGWLPEHLYTRSRMAPTWAVVPPGFLTCRKAWNCCSDHALRSACLSGALKENARGSHFTPSSPGVLVPPRDLHVLQAVLDEPRFELVSLQIERRRRDQMVEDDAVVLAEAESRQAVQVVV